MAISQDWASAQVTDHLGSSGKGHGGHDDTLAGLKADGFEREVQGGGAGIEGDGVFLIQVGGEIALELLGLGARGEPTALEGIDDLRDFLRADAGFVEGDFQDGRQEIGDE